MGSRMLYVHVREAAEGLKMEVSISRDILEALLASGRDTLHASQIEFRTPSLPKPDDERDREHEIVQANLFSPDA